VVATFPQAQPAADFHSTTPAISTAKNEVNVHTQPQHNVHSNLHSKKPTHNLSTMSTAISTAKANVYMLQRCLQEK